MVDDDQALIDRAMDIDPDRSTFILACGRKGSGKSEALRAIFDAWPYDRGILDITGDARPDDPATVAIGMPANTDREHYRKHDEDRLTFWIRVNTQQDEKTFLAQQDEAMRLGLYPQKRPFFMLVDEYGRMVPNGRALPNTSLALQSSRHYDLSLGLGCPRPVFIGPLTIMQADIVLIYELPNRADREVIAQNIGFPVPAFEDAYFANQSRPISSPDGKQHAFLMWHAGLSRLFDCPALPITRSHGGRA